MWGEASGKKAERKRGRGDPTGVCTRDKFGTPTKTRTTGKQG